MKTAVLLVGYVRTWGQCKDSFQQAFGHLNPDIYVSTYRRQFGHHPHIQGRIGDSSDHELTEQQVRSMFDGYNAVVDIRPPLSMDYFYGAVDPMFHSADASFGQQLNWYNAIRMMTNTEKRTGEYDLVIKTRCDLLYEPFEIGDRSRNVLVDSGNVFPNDCVVIANRKAMIDICNFMTEEFFRPSQQSSGHAIPHGLLHNAINASGCGIDTAKIMHGVIRKTGEIHYY